MSKKKATTFSMVVTGTLILSSKPFCVLSDIGTTHSFISTRSTLPLDLENAKKDANYKIKLPVNSIVDCPIFYEHAPIYIDGTIFLKS